MTNSRFLSLVVRTGLTLVWTTCISVACTPPTVLGDGDGPPKRGEGEGEGDPRDGWLCDLSFFGDGQVCNCGCGVPDPDCNGDGCVGDDCSDDACQLCAQGGELRFCFEFCATCASDADCPLGVCVPDVDGPGEGFCTASCDFCTDPEFCGSDGNCGTALQGDVCNATGDGVESRDYCGNLRASVSCEGGFCNADKVCQEKAGLGESVNSCTECASGSCLVFVGNPQPWCTEPCNPIRSPDSCAAEAPGMACQPGDPASCTPVLLSRCNTNGTGTEVFDAFGRRYEAFDETCAAGAQCVDQTDDIAAPHAACVGSSTLGATCTAGGACVSTACIGFAGSDDHNFCSEDCSGDPGLCGSNMICNQGFCTPILAETCSADGRTLQKVDDFRREWPDLNTTCGAGTHCVQRVDANGRPDAACEPLAADGFACTAAADCAGGICASFPDHPELSWCSTSCTSNAQCDTNTTCNVNGICQPNRRNRCSDNGVLGRDGDSVVDADDFGRTYRLVSPCPAAQECDADAFGAECVDVCGRPSGCTGIAGLVNCCGPDVFSGGQCCQRCNFDGDSSVSCVAP